MLPREVLLSSREKPLWEEKSADPKDLYLRREWWVECAGVIMRMDRRNWWVTGFSLVCRISIV